MGARAWRRGATSAEYLRGFEEAERRLGITTEDSAPNRNNAALRAAARRWATSGNRSRATPRAASSAAAPAATVARSGASSPRC